MIPASGRLPSEDEIRSVEGLWSITAYFNPLGKARRLENYRAFRAALRCRLVTVELGFGEFALDTEDADILVQIPGRDLLWQKERLLNVAMEQLPDDCDKVAWLDSDIVFVRSDWVAATSRALDDHRIVQPFSTFQEILPPRNSEASSYVRVHGTRRASIARRMIAGELPTRIFKGVGWGTKLRYAPGMAWAARREVLEEGLYDALILGGGDKAMASAIYGHHEATADTFEMSDRQRSHYAAWARRFHELTGGEAGFVRGELFHYWHGRHDRRLLRPYEGFSKFNFDPASNIGIDEHGAWRWASEKPDLHRRCAHYLMYREEDLESLPLESVGRPKE